MELVEEINPTREIPSARWRTDDLTGVHLTSRESGLVSLTDYHKFANIAVATPAPAIKATSQSPPGKLYRGGFFKG